jgi:hypothetical protein
VDSKVLRSGDEIAWSQTSTGQHGIIVKEDADRHSAKLRWILEQVPLVEAELRESKVKGGSHTGHRTKRRLGQIQDYEVTGDRGHQKRRRSNQVTLFSDGSAKLSQNGQASHPTTQSMMNNPRSALRAAVAKP